MKSSNYIYSSQLTNRLTQTDKLQPHSNQTHLYFSQGFYLNCAFYPFLLKCNETMKKEHRATMLEEPN